MSPCMLNNRGQRVDDWLPAMQSSEFLRESIAAGNRTAECWAELKERRQRVHAALAVLAARGLSSTSPTPQNNPMEGAP